MKTKLCCMLFILLAANFVIAQPSVDPSVPSVSVDFGDFSVSLDNFGIEVKSGDCSYEFSTNGSNYSFQFSWWID